MVSGKQISIERHQAQSYHFQRRKNPIEHVYRIGKQELERFKEIKDLDVFLEKKPDVFNPY
jgi:hypothetical protein